MNYSKEEVLLFVEEEDVKFIRLAFVDIFGHLKNISITKEKLKSAFTYGIPFDGSAVFGTSLVAKSDLLLHPHPETLTILPWRPEHGKVVRMLCSISNADGSPFEWDSRSILEKQVLRAKSLGYTFHIGSEQEFYLFKLDDEGQATITPYDMGSYMDVAPSDRGENIRREICFALEKMGIQPLSSHHEEGPGQNEITYAYSEPLEAAANAVTFESVVKILSSQNGLCADFTPKPALRLPGNGFHIHFSIEGATKDVFDQAIAGVLSHVSEMTLFLNNSPKSYERLGALKAPKYLSWGTYNRSQLIRIPAGESTDYRAELRSPDSSMNPYIGFALLISAALDGIEKNMQLPIENKENLFEFSKEKRNLSMLPSSKAEAATLAKESEFISSTLPKSLILEYMK